MSSSACAHFNYNWSSEINDQTSLLMAVRYGTFGLHEYLNMRPREEQTQDPKDWSILIYRNLCKCLVTLQYFSTNHYILLVSKNQRIGQYTYYDCQGESLHRIVCMTPNRYIFITVRFPWAPTVTWIHIYQTIPNTFLNTNLCLYCSVGQFKVYCLEAEF